MPVGINQPATRTPRKSSPACGKLRRHLPRQSQRRPLESTRMIVGLLTAALLPYSVPSVAAKRLNGLLLSIIFGVYVVAPLLTNWRGPSLLALLVAWIAPLTHWHGKRQQSMVSSPGTTASPSRGHPPLIAFLVAIAAVATMLVISILVNSPATWHALHDVIFDDRIAIVLIGFLSTIFVGHIPAVFISAKSSGHRITEQYGLPAVDPMGIAIAWFERALVFIFVVGGQVGGAALAVTAKSLARYPALERKEIDGNYFLIGTFTSVLIGILGAILTRIGLGFSAL